MNAPAVAVDRPPNAIVEIRHQLDAMSGQFAAALPAHISVARFARVVMTALQNNPELLECERRSLWNAAIKAAQDGLFPDGREGAMVVRWDPKRGKLANWQPMIAGIRKKVRNSGEIATWDVVAVYANDEFDYQLGDDPFIRHKPTLGDPGPLKAAYSIATLKTGEKSRDVMSVSKAYELRDRYSDGWKAFKAGKIKSTPWSTAEDEMVKKTVARRHSKVLPMSTDLDDLIRREDDPHDEMETARADAKAAQQTTLSSRLDMLARIPATAETHDPDTGEIADDRVAPVTGARIETPQEAPNNAPAAGPPASGNPSQGDPPGAGEAADEPLPDGEPLSLEEMAREAAMRGEDVFKAFYKGRSAQERKLLNGMSDELQALMP